MAGKGVRITCPTTYSEENLQCLSANANTFDSRWIFRRLSSPNTANGSRLAYSGNYLPLWCKALYRFDDTGLGVRFLNLSQFERELISSIITHRLDEEGVPVQVDPFHTPPSFLNEHPNPRVTDIRAKADSILDKIMAPEL
ncbi:MAG: hypothetical protein DYH05_07590 [Acidobacteria bacterium ACB1]|nr:hypothetical protein [Acidobacteria bacterium ACB1]